MFMYYSQEMIDAIAAQQEKTQMSISFDEKEIFKQIRLEGDFTLTSGKKSKYFYDFERISPNYMTFISGLLHEKCKNIDFEFVIGPAYGGIIPGYCVADFAGKEFVAFNPRTLAFRGNLNTISGRYIVVDDVVSTYGTIDTCIEQTAIKYPSTRCVGAACFVFRGEKVRGHSFPTFYLHHGDIER